MAENLELVIRAKNLTKEQFDEITRQVQALGGEVEKTGGVMGGGASQAAAFGLAAGVGAIAVEKLAAAAAATYTAILDMVSGFVQAGSAIDDMRLKTALGAEEIQLLAYQGSLVGVSMDTIGTAVVRMSKNVEEGSVKARTAIVGLGLNVASLQAMNPADQFNAIATALRGIADPGKQASLAMTLFGRNTEILKVLRSDTESARQEFERLGFAMSDEAVGSADELGDAITTLEATWDGLKNQIGGAIVKNTEATSAMEGLTVILSNVIAGGTDATTTMGKLGGSFGLAAIRAIPLINALGLVSKGLALFADDLPNVAATTKTTFGEMGVAAIDFQALMREGERQSVADVKEGNKQKGDSARALAAVRKKLASETAAVEKNELSDLMRYWTAMDKSMVALEKQAAKESEEAWLAYLRNIKAGFQQWWDEREAQGKKQADDEKKRVEDEIELYAKMGDVLGLTGQLFVALGLEGNKALSGLLDAGNAALAVFSNLASGNIWGAIMAGISGVISLVGALKGILGDFFDWLGGLFGGGSPYEDPIPPFPDVPNPKNGGGGGWPDPDNDPNQGYASGGYFPYRPGGYGGIRLGEAGDEAILNVPQMRAMMQQAIAGAAAQMGGSYQGGGTTTTVINTHLNSRVIAREVVTNGTRRRQGRVSSGGIRGRA